MLSIAKLKQTLDNILFDIYFLNAKYYTDFTIYYSDKKYKYLGQYCPSENEIILIDHNLSDELFICAALHELSHHIQFVDNGYTNHQKEFYSIHKSLLFSAFKQNIINPSKLLVAEEEVSHSCERHRIAKYCREYISHHDDVEIYDIGFVSTVLDRDNRLNYDEGSGSYYYFYSLKK